MYGPICAPVGVGARPSPQIRSFHAIHRVQELVVGDPLHTGVRMTLENFARISHGVIESVDSAFWHSMENLKIF